MKKALLPIVLVAAAGAAQADFKVDMRAIDVKGIGKSIGTVTVAAAPGGAGVVFKPALKGLIPGEHGFHVHENQNCAAAEKEGKSVPGEAAGAHWDPDKSGKHAGPTGAGHRGDLPALEVAADGTANKAVTAPHLKLADVGGKALIVHAGGDNYSDSPKPSGGGGDRIACGLIGTK